MHWMRRKSYREVFFSIYWYGNAVEKVFSKQLVYVYCLWFIILQELKQTRDKEQKKHDKMLEEGKKIAELNHVDVDEEHTSKLYQIRAMEDTLGEMW